jgi:regulatory protein
MPFRRTSAARDPANREDPVAARAAATALLARRDFATQELRSKLAARGFAADAIGTALAELQSTGFLNDERFLQNYVAYHAARGQGPMRITSALRRLQLHPAAIEAALAGGTDWVALARSVRKGKFGSQLPTRWAEKARQARFLQYRGFSSDHIRAAMGADFDPD